MQFTDWWNTGGQDLYLDNLVLFRADADHAYRHAYEKPHDQERKFGLRISSLGDPMGALVLRHLGYVSKVNFISTPVSGLDRHKFFWGNLTEALVLQAMRDKGIKVTAQQQPLEFEGVVGHPDAVLDDYLVLDIKTAKASSYSYMQYQGLPQRYRTQVIAYREALGLTEAAVLVINKDTHEASLFPVSRDEGEVAELRRNVQWVRGFTSLDQFLEAYSSDPSFYVPDCIPERYKGANTGDCLVPPSMAFTGYAGVFYDLELAQSSNPTKKEPIYFVRGYNTPDEIPERLIPYTEVISDE